MNRYAIVNLDSNIVDNVVIWDGTGEPWQPFLAIALEADERCGPGYTYDPNASPRFVEPVQPEPDP